MIPLPVEGLKMIQNLGSILGSGRYPWEGNGYPLQYSCLENPWTEEPGGVQYLGSQRVRQDWATNTYTVSSVQLLSQVQLCVTPWTAAFQACLLSPSPPAFNLSNHLGLCQWVISLHQVAKVLELQLQHQSLQRTLGWTGLIFLQS